MRDTTAQARVAQISILRRLSPSERVAIACELSEEVVALTADGMRHRDPSLSDEQVAGYIRRLLVGSDLAERRPAGRAQHR